jgi:hypothetical protein
LGDGLFVEAVIVRVNMKLTRRHLRASRLGRRACCGDPLSKAEDLDAAASLDSAVTEAETLVLI